MFLDHKDKDMRWMIRVFGLLIYFGILLLVYGILKPFLVSIFSAIILSYIFYPIFRFFVEKTRFGKNISSILTIVIMIAIFIVPVIFLSIMMVQEGFILYSNFHGVLSLNAFSNFCNNYDLCHKFMVGDGGFIYSVVSSRLNQWASNLINWMFLQVYNIVKSIPEILFNIFFSLFFSFFFIRDGPKIYQKTLSFIPIEKKYVNKLAGEMESLVSAIVFGSLLTVFIQGLVAMIGYRLVGINSFVFFGILTMISALVPAVGTGLVWAPLAAVLFIQGIAGHSNGLIIKSIVLFFYGLLVVGTIDNIIRPFLIGDKTKVHPAVILIGIVGGITFMGLLGIFYGPILLSLVLSFSAILREEWSG